ncbi:MAG: thioredoxin family protein [Pseudomonadota bacterium]
MAATPPVCDFGWKAPSFDLLGVDGETHRLPELRGANGTLVMFICNHCPYVKAIVDRIVRDADELAPLGVSSIAICSNDAEAYPEDGYDRMRAFAERRAFSFPYLHDADQSVARAYGAMCTPDFFGFNADLKLQYRGRLDASRAQAGPENLRRDLFEAMRLIAETGEGPAEQAPSVGCSIKWRAA